MYLYCGVIFSVNRVIILQPQFTSIRLHNEGTASLVVSGLHIVDLLMTVCWDIMSLCLSAFSVNGSLNLFHSDRYLQPTSIEYTTLGFYGS